MHFDYDNFFIPRLNQPYALLLLLFLAQLLAIVLTLVNPEHLNWQAFAYNSLFIHWNLLIMVGIISAIRPLLILSGEIAASVIFLILAPIITLSLTYLMQEYLIENFKLLDYLRFSIISFIVAAVLLRSFYLQAQWHKLRQAELHARIESLQARIRPHFLFNSLNSIISLLSLDIAKAEQAILDLADLFRANLASSNTLITFEKEISLAKSYIAIEQYRFSYKLQIKWEIENVPPNTPIAQLTLQPLLENAIIHGVQNSCSEQIINVNAKIAHDFLELAVINSYAKQEVKSKGAKHALANIELRIKALFGEQAELKLSKKNQEFTALVRYPIPKMQS